MHLPSLLCITSLALSSAAFADEGMWTFNNFPFEKVQAKYGWAPDEQWLDHVRLASVRLAGGCSASVVSPDGLVMTNHHCAHSCIEQLSTSKKDFVHAGFWAAKASDEVKCPKIELNQLVEISDVTKVVQDATKATEIGKFDAVQRAKIAELETACATSTDLRCDVVSLYHGGHFDLYKYRRYQDVRLVFAPEFDIAFFGGDPDNFNFPRYDLDVSFLRIYGKDGKPQKTEHFLPFSTVDAKDGDLSFVSGNPGGTNRLLTVAQLENLRDIRHPTTLAKLSEQRGMFTEYAKRGAEQKRHSSAKLFGIENSLKNTKGRHAALADRTFFDSKRAAEAGFRAAVDANPELKKQYGGIWDALSANTEKERAYRKEYLALENTMGSEAFAIARQLVRAAEELPKPNGERLREYADARLPQLKQGLFSKAPIHDEFEIANLTFSLIKIREDLGADNTVVKQILGKRSPEEVATAAVKGTRLKDIKYREALFADGKGKDKIASSTDSMIALARLMDPSARAIRKIWEDEVDGPRKKYGEQLAKAHVAVYGTDSYPDATFTLRLSYGTIKGYVDNGVEVKPVTLMGGVFERATGRDPFTLPASWLKAQTKIAPATPMNVTSTNDIIGGNSGSPMVNKAGELIGLVFDGNIQSLAGDYYFDEAVNRTISVHSAALLQALEKVYGAKRLVDELRPKSTLNTPETNAQTKHRSPD